MADRDLAPARRHPEGRLIVIVNPDQPNLRHVGLPSDAAAILLTGDWTTIALAPRARGLSEELRQWAAHPHVSWDLSGVQTLDQTGALLLWRAWGRLLPAALVMPPTLQEYFTHMPQAVAESAASRVRLRLSQLVAQLGLATFEFFKQLREIVVLIGRLVLDVVDAAKHPRRWPGREVSAGVYRGGAQALGILGLVGFLIGVVLSYLAGDQLRRLGAEIYVVNLLGIGCIRELGPLLAAILVAGRSGSSMTAQLGVMRLNEEVDALTTMGVRPTQRLILPKVVALALAQPLAGLWTTAVALLGGMIAAHLSLGVGYHAFLDELPKVVPAVNYWIGLGKGVVFGLIIAITACHFGLRVKPDTESLGAGTTSSVVVAISSALVADALFAVLFSHVGI
jgi:phospholipid/cholesterol/gamma-HCH transport system permease protein